MRKLTCVYVTLLTIATAACSEGLAPSSPLAPGSPGATHAKGGGKPSADIPVVTTIQGTDIASDGPGDYDTAVIQSVGAWLLDLGGSPDRTIYLDFDAFDPPGPDTSLSGHYKARLIAQCNRAPYNVNMLTMSSGGTAETNETIVCPLYVRFDAPSGSYRISMNSTETAGASDDVNVTCTLGAPCTRWEIAPGGPTSRGVLDRQGKGTTWVRQGTFDFSFRIDVSKP
jgi:hypothetical protein